jgi:toxin YoeB
MDLSRRRKRNALPPEPRVRLAIRLSDDFIADSDYWAEHSAAVHRKLLELMNAVVAEPFRGIGKPEPMKHEYRGCWSRRLTKVDRMVYRIYPTYVDFLSARHHYPRRW